MGKRTTPDPQRREVDREILKGRRVGGTPVDRLSWGSKSAERAPRRGVKERGASPTKGASGQNETQFSGKSLVEKRRRKSRWDRGQKNTSLLQKGKKFLRKHWSRGRVSRAGNLWKFTSWKTEGKKSPRLGQGVRQE